MKISKRKKAIIFFGFYIFFFLILFSFFNNKKVIKPRENKDDEMVINDIFYFNDAIRDDYQYEYEIVIDDEKINYHGTKNEIDYGESEYKYFLDIYHINQLIKKSKVLEKVDNYGKYSLNNSELDSLLSSSESTGKTIIEIKENQELEVDIDLHDYYQKDVFQMKLIFKRVTALNNVIDGGDNID